MWDFLSDLHYMGLAYLYSSRRKRPAGWSINSGVHNAQGEEGEIGWPVQYRGCWPWCFLVLLEGRHLPQEKTALWKLLNASEIIGIWVIVHWKSQISDVIPALLFKRAFFNHPSIPQGKLHWSPQNNVNLLDLIIFLECSNELFRIALKARSKI